MYCWVFSFADSAKNFASFAVKVRFNRKGREGERKVRKVVPEATQN